MISVMTVTASSTITLTQICILRQQFRTPADIARQHLRTSLYSSCCIFNELEVLHDGPIFSDIACRQEVSFVCKHRLTVD